MIRLGENNVPYNDTFRFFMTTKLPNPHYAPEVCVKVTLLNFAITMQGLEDQLLGAAIKVELPEVEEAKNKAGVNTSIIFVPPPFAAEAVIEASYAGMDLIVCITEGIPVQDMVKVKRVIDENGTRLIGPNCPGIITVDECKLGIMPGFICKKGNIGVISKSGTLTYEAIGQLVSNGMGQTTALGIGGDPIIGTDMRDALELFEADPETEGIVLIGEIGGQMEIEAARWAKDNVSKPIVGFISGQTAPPGRRMGHAGAIVSGGDDTAEAKMRIMKECGIDVCESVAEIGQKMKASLQRKTEAIA